ncbi:hypothetical protein KSF73_12030 [Burkholderiaceae bacterium DAT-1]|nr:hypothetical protein [Burkholderiaceae bacterium DAT-1]
MTSPQYSLVAGAVLTCLAALLHFVCIIWPEGFRIMGAGESISRLAITGHWYPRVAAIVIGSMLLVWAAYAFSGAGLIVPLPFTKLALTAITGVYLLRGIAFPLLIPAFPGNSMTFWYVSSGIFLLIGGLHVAGLIRIWSNG